MTVNLRAQISDYASRVLGVIKEKYGLKDKSEAINRFAEMFGGEFIEKEVKDEAVKAMIRECEEWEKTHKFKRKMSINELDKLCGI